MAADFDYDVFISYSRDPIDRDVAPRLQEELQRFARPWFRPRARTLRVFRDQTNLPPSPDLWGSLEQVMSSSRWLVLLASPRSAQSQGVRRELEWWREHRGTANICIALADGELRWDDTRNDFDWATTTALPREALGHAFAHEPAWIDLRSVVQDEGLGRRTRLQRFTRSLTDPRLQDAAASLIAEIKRVPKDTLIGEHLRRGRQTRRAVTSTFVILVLLLAVSVTAGLVARSQRNRAVHQATISEAGQLAAIAETLTGSHLDLAELFAAEAYRLYPDPQTSAALFGAVTADPHLVRYLSATGSVSAVATSADGHTAVAGTASGDVLRWNLSGFQRSVVAKLPAAISSIAVSANGNTIAAVDDAAAMVWVHGAGVRRVPVPARWTTVAAAVSPSGRYAAFSVHGPAGSQSLLLIDEQTGRSVIAHTDVVNFASNVAFSGETQLVIMGFGGGWERFAIPSLAVKSAFKDFFGAQESAQTMSATGTFISYTNAAGPPLYVYDTLTTPTSFLPPLGAWESGDGPSSLAISADGRVAADADSGTIYVSHITSFKDASPRTLLSLPGNTTVNPNTLTFIGHSNHKLLSASGSLVTVWDLDQYSRISSAASADIPAACFACAGPGIYSNSEANHAIITAASGSTAVIVSLPPKAGSARVLPQKNASITYGPALWSPDGRNFSILTPNNGGGQIWSTAGKLVRNWVPGKPIRPDNGDPDPVSLLSAANGREIVELDMAGNIIIRNSQTGAVEHQVVGPVKPDAPDRSSQYLAAADPEAKYAAVIVPIGEHGSRVDVVNISTGAINGIPGGAASGVAYGGETLLIQRADGTFEVRSADGQQLIRSFAGDLNAAAGPAVNSAGVAVEVNSDGTAPVFDIGSGQEIGSITLPASPRYASTSIAFTPDGKHLISATEATGGSADGGHITEWNFSPSFWSKVACTSAGRALTREEWQEYIGAGGPGMPSHMACQP